MQVWNYAVMAEYSDDEFVEQEFAITKTKSQYPDISMHWKCNTEESQRICNYTSEFHVSMQLGS